MPISGLKCPQRTEAAKVCGIVREAVSELEASAKFCVVLLH